jgi:branched-chain amino acid transport system permease protein
MAIRPSGVYDVNYVQDQAIFRTKVDWFWSIVILVALFLLPQFSANGLLGSIGLDIVSLSLITVLTTAGLLLISITGLNILLGYTGQISLGQAAFMMVGAYTSTVFADQLGLSFLLSLPLAILITGLIGLVFGLASLRVKGFYLAMATLAAQFIIPWAITSYQEGGLGNVPLIGGTLDKIELNEFQRVQTASILGFKFNTILEEYYLVLFFVLVSAMIARNLIRSRIGRAWISVRDNDLAAEQLGINVFRYKVLAFFVCALYAGLAGSLKAHIDGSISKDTFNLEYSIELLAMLVIGGAGFPLGPTFGVAFFIFMDRWMVDQMEVFLVDRLPDVLTFLEPENIAGGLPFLLFGILLAFFLIYEPRGLAYRWRILQVAWRLRPFSKI